MAQLGEIAIYTAFEDSETHDAAEPEKNLMRAILRLTMEDLKKGGEKFRDSRAYIMSNDDEYLFSFLSVCYHLDLCPRTIRRVCGVLSGQHTVAA